MKRVLGILLISVFIFSAGVQAFPTADIRPGYSSLLYSVQVGERDGGISLNALRLGFDFGLTHTVGMEAVLCYTGSGRDNLTDLGVKFRLSERGPTEFAAKMGFHGTPVENWIFTLGFRMDHELTSFFRLHAGGSISFVEEFDWGYFIGADYSLSPSISLQGGVNRNIRQGGLGDFMFGLRTSL